MRHSLNIDLPLPAIGRDISASETINIYSEPDFSSEVIARAGRTSIYSGGTHFMLLEIGEEAVFEGVSSYWAYVELWHSTGLETTRTDTTGWVFLGLMIY